LQGEDYTKKAADLEICKEQRRANKEGLRVYNFVQSKTHLRKIRSTGPSISRAGKNEAG